MTYKDLCLHLGPLADQKGDIAGARVSKFVNGHVKNNISGIITDMVHRRDMGKRQIEATKGPIVYLLENLIAGCRCDQVREADGSVGSLLEDFASLLRMHGPHIEETYVKWYTHFFTGAIGHSKKRSLLITGPSDTGKSIFGSLVRRQLPRSRVFLPLAGSEFCWDDLDSDMHLLGFSNDWRFSHKLPVQPCLNWLEGLDFKFNRKHQKPAEGKGPLCIFTSNDVQTGWKQTDINAFFARMYAVLPCLVTIHMAGIPEREASSRVEKCVKCGACALLWKSAPLRNFVNSNYPASYKLFEQHMRKFQPSSSRIAEEAPRRRQTEEDEWEALVAEAEMR